jgi:hypothetical protein
VPNEYEWGESFQQKLLALYIREPQTTFSIVEPSYFTSPVHVDVARLAKEVYEKHNRSEVRLSCPTLLAIVKGYLGKKRREVWPGYRKVIRSLYEENINDRQVVLQQVTEFAREQKFRKALVDAEKDVNGRNFARAIDRFDQLKGFGIDADLGVEYWKDFTDPGRWLEDRRGVIGTFYLPTLDNAMEGGLGCGELGVVLAGGKVGKSTLLARFAAGALWQRKNVAIATGELSDRKYRKRIDAMLTATPTWELTQFAKVDDEESDLMKKLREAQNKMFMARGHMKGSLWIKQYPTGKGRINDIELWIERLRQSGVDIDILFVDYIRTFRPNERFEEQRLSIGQVCMDLRGLAIEKDIPVWTASQTNRAALRKERIGPEDIAEDISQFWTLDFMIALCQTEVEEKLKPQKARIMLTAARDVGRGKTIDILLDRNTFRVWEKFGFNRNKKKGTSNGRR